LTRVGVFACHTVLLLCGVLFFNAHPIGVPGD
jgi:hypothetical protein